MIISFRALCNYGVTDILYINQSLLYSTSSLGQLRYYPLHPPDIASRHPQTVAVQPSLRIISVTALKAHCSRDVTYLKVAYNTDVTLTCLPIIIHPRCADVVATSV